ncbi:hypothetical protein N7533_009650 [Penicillium manginii]|uniref:uncharacterized protein n=1 Tax=Penicillium manginii TaxID=203109 RepID=UPI0025474925|nr:uncharacterized protein N7533_009650 [Penicillium manginii]KAJ5744780.1 hypothetical protein N7533_009650 [Penicillium manginii]
MADDKESSAVPSSGPQTTEELPTPETCRKIEDYQVLDREGKKHSFKSVYDGPSSADRVVVIFIRHFFCGPEGLLKLPTSTSIAIVGCGDPGLIDSYASRTGCQFPIYADPTQKLYEDLGMVSNLAMGPQPGYIRKSMLRVIGESVVQSLKQIPSGLALKGGPSNQNGGEIIYESAGEGQPKQMTWCHRMTTTRDHIEVDELVKVLDPSQQYFQNPQE